MRPKRLIKNGECRSRTSAQLEVRVQPGAKRNALEAVAGRALKAYVTAPPEGGKANDALVTLLAKALGVARGRVRIVRGHRSRKKLVTIEGVSSEDVLLRLRAGGASGTRPGR